MGINSDDSIYPHDAAFPQPLLKISVKKSEASRCITSVLERFAFRQESGFERERIMDAKARRKSISESI